MTTRVGDKDAIVFCYGNYTNTVLKYFATHMTLIHVDRGLIVYCSHFHGVNVYVSAQVVCCSGCPMLELSVSCTIICCS